VGFPESLGTGLAAERQLCDLQTRGDAARMDKRVPAKKVGSNSFGAAVSAGGDKLQLAGLVAGIGRHTRGISAESNRKLTESQSFDVCQRRSQVVAVSFEVDSSPRLPLVLTLNNFR
jgi:hypothetical protein